MQYIAGVEKVMNNLMRQKAKYLDQISEAVDQSALKVANHAKRGHRFRKEKEVRATGQFAEDIKSFSAFGMYGTITSATRIRPGLDPHSKERFVSRTGTLVRSITPQLTKVRFNIIEAQVYSNVEYAPKVELGTSKTKPYPFLFPALVVNQEDFKARVAKAAKP